LRAWRVYKELCFELQDKERPIRFTPAPGSFHLAETESGISE